MSVTDEIKARLDIVNYIQQYVPLKKAGRYYKAPCPFHSEKTPSFVVNAERQSWRCFGACAEGGDIFNFAMKYHGWSFPEALQELGRAAGVEVQRQTPEQKAQSDALDQLRGLLQEAADTYHRYLLSDSPDAQATLRYTTEKRGFSHETIETFAIGYAPPGWDNMLNYLRNLGYSEEQILDAGIASRNERGKVYDRFRNRLIIPIRDERGRVIGFGARVLDPNDNPKYLNSPQSPVFDKSRVLFGLDRAKEAIRQGETAVIVEGYMDAIQAHQAGFTNVVAQMGTAMTEPQLKLLAPRYAKKVILALDSDAAGQNATMRSLEVARQTLSADFSGKLSVDMRVLQIPGAKDPDDLLRENPDQWQSLVDHALPVADFVIDMETASLGDNPTVQEREAVARRLLPILLASENNLYKQDNIQKLALRLRIGESDLLAWARDHRPDERTAPRYAGPMPPEPPPPDYEHIMPPPDAEDDDSTLVDLSRLVPLSADVALEQYCLRMLLLHPDSLYLANRKFRELAGENLDLANGPLCDVGVADFSHSDYREMMQAFESALAQDVLEPLDYLRERIPPSMLVQLDGLLVDDLADVRSRVRNRMAAEIAATWKQHERLVVPSLDVAIELTRRVLDLRKRRLRRESEELRFLQMGTSDEFEDDALQFAHHIMLTMRATGLIDAELQRLNGTA